VTIICRIRFVVRWGEVLMASLRLQICPTTTSLTPLSHPFDLLAKTREPLLLLPRSTQKPHLKRKKKHRVLSGFARVMGRPARSTGFCRVVAPACFLTNPDRSNHRVDRVPGHPAGPVRV